MPEAIDAGAIARHDPAAHIVRLSGETMGTIWHVQLVAPRRYDGAHVRAAIVAALDAVVAEMSHWEPGSALSRFGRLEAGAWLALPPRFATVMAAALAIAEASDGAFDPAIGALVDLWGFGPIPADTIPGDADVAAALATGGWQRLAYDGAARRLRQPGGLRLDLSGIAKGHAVDRVAAVLAEQGIADALVEIGGELSGRGIRPDLDPWWVDLETPVAAIAPLRVALHQLAVATSGYYVRGRHTIDPRTGRPAADVIAVSVIHPSAMIADAWATALGVVDADICARLCDTHELPARVIRRTAHEPIEWISPALARMIAD